MEPLDEATIRAAIRKVCAASMVPTPAGRAAVSRETVLAELGVEPKNAARVDWILSQLGVGLGVLRDPRSQGLRAWQPWEAPQEGAVFYIVAPKGMLQEPSES